MLCFDLNNNPVVACWLRPGPIALMFDTRRYVHLKLQVAHLGDTENMSNFAVVPGEINPPPKESLRWHSRYR